MCDDDEGDTQEAQDNELADKCNELDGKYNELADKYNELASKYNELASAPFIIPVSENDNSSKRLKKLFI